MERGANPRTTALEIVGRVNRATGQREGGLLGLTSQQMGWARNASDELSSGDPAALRAYLGRKARDRRFDRTVTKAIREEKPVAAADVRRIVKRYEDKLLAYRGAVIGRTETLTSLNAAKHEGLMQLVDQGKVQAHQIKRVWSATMDGRTRDTHRTMDGQTVGLNEYFITPLGYRMLYPGDTEHGAPASETISCRCFTTVRVDFLAGVQ